MPGPRPGEGRRVAVNWLAHVFGLDNGSGSWYLFWSGAGADLGELAIVGGLISIYRRHNCGVRWCPRLARHDFTDPDTEVPGHPEAVRAGITHHLCRKHHPLHGKKPVTAAHIQEQYHLYLGKQRGKG